MREIANKVSWRPSLQFWLLLVIVGVALAAAFGPVPMRTVQANADLSKPTIVMPPVTSPTPRLVEDIPGRAEDPGESAARFCLLVWNGVQWPADCERRNLRHVRHDSMPPDPALWHHGAGGEYAEPPVSHCSDHGSRAAVQRADYGPVLRGGAESWTWSGTELRP